MRILNVEIKERIEAIYRGEIPEGYRKTEIGIIPEDWEVKAIEKILELKNGVNAKKEDYGHGIKFINVLDILNNNHINYENIIGKVNADERVIKNNSVSYGDILFQRSSETVEEVGYANVYLDKKIAIFGGFVIRGRKIFDYEPLFLKELLNSDISRRQIESRAAGSTRFNIGQKELYEVKLSLPLIYEQQKIAQILSTWDKAIELKEELIKKKREQKKGLMQKLLTGEMRLLGFGGDWEKVKLGEIFTERREIGCNDFELLAITSDKGIVRRNEIVLKDISSSDKSKYKKIMPLDIGYNTMRMWQGVSGVSKYKGIVSPAYTILKPISVVNSYFMGYLFKMSQIINLFRRYSQGLVNDTLNLKYNNFRKIEVTIPRSLKEQKSIAQILSTADKEIELLTKELELLKQQKKGLMQLLLTGIVRVKI